MLVWNKNSMGGCSYVTTGSQVNHQYYGNRACKLGFILILFYHRRNPLIDLFIYFVLLLFQALRVLLFALFCSLSVKYFNLFEIVKVLGLAF